MARPLRPDELERQNVGTARFSGTQKTPTKPNISYRNPGNVGWDTTASPRPTISSRFNEERTQGTGITNQSKRSDDTTFDTEITNTQIERQYSQASVYRKPFESTPNEYLEDDLSYESGSIPAPKKPGVGKRTLQVATRTLRRTAAKPVFTVMLSIHFWIWVTLQLTLALISLAFMAVDGALDSTWLGRRVADVAGAVASVTKWVGADISSLNPKAFFLLIHSITTQLMWGIVLITVLAYFLMQFKAVSGRATGLKMITLIAAIIGYAFPISNLLPWIFLYIFVMLKYPD